MAKVTPNVTETTTREVTLKLTEKEAKALVLILGRISDRGSPQIPKGVWQTLRDAGFDYRYALGPVNGQIDLNSDDIERDNLWLSAK